MNRLQEILYIIAVLCLGLFIIFVMCGLLYFMWVSDFHIVAKIVGTILYSGMMSLAIAQGMNRTGDE